MFSIGNYHWLSLAVVVTKRTIPIHATAQTFYLQAASSMLLANLEREKELLRVFLKVSQMENKILRRMNLGSFLMVSFGRAALHRDSFIPNIMQTAWQWVRTAARRLKQPFITVPTIITASLLDH